MPTKTNRTIAPCLAALLCACGSVEPSVPAPATPSPSAVEPAIMQTQLRGTLVGHDGAPIELAEVHVIRPGEADLDVQADAEGRFALRLDGPGLAKLQFTGVDHAQTELHVDLDGNAHELDVRLGTYPRPETYAGRESIAAFGAFAGPAGEDGRVEAPKSRDAFAFVPREDGTWVATIERGEADADATEFHYQLIELTEVGRTVNGTASKRFVYDGGGDYLSVVSATTAGPIEIAFDPAALAPAGQKPALALGDPDSEFARFAQLSLRLEDWANASEADFRARMAASQGDPAAAFAASKRDLFARLEAELADHEGRRRSAILLTMLTTSAHVDDLGLDDALVDELLATLAPGDSLWSLQSGAMTAALRQREDPAYFARAAAEQRDDAVVGDLWFSALLRAVEAGELERAREAFRALQAERFAGSIYPMMAAMYDPDRPSAPGKPVPDFSLTSIDGKHTYSAEAMRGKTYAIDFWATWCGPCVASMPALHASWARLNGLGLDADKAASPKAYRKLRTDGFEIISVSFDHGDTKAVEAYRREHWPMPWANVAADEATEKQLRAAFGVTGIPAIVLVGPDGTILDSGPALRAETLEDRVRALAPG